MRREQNVVEADVGRGRGRFVQRLVAEDVECCAGDVAGFDRFSERFIDDGFERQGFAAA